MFKAWNSSQNDKHFDPRFFLLLAFILDYGY